MNFTKKSDWGNTLLSPKFAEELQRMDDALQELCDNSNSTEGAGATYTVQLTTFSQLDEIIAANRSGELTLYTFIVLSDADEGLQPLVGHTVLGVCESYTDIALTDTHTNIGYTYHNGTTSLSIVTPDKLQYIGAFYSASALLAGLQSSNARYIIFDTDGPFSLDVGNPYIAVLSNDRSRYYIHSLVPDRNFTTITLEVSDGSITNYSNPIIRNLVDTVCTSVSEFRDMCVATGLADRTMFYCLLSSGVHSSFSQDVTCIGFDVQYFTDGGTTDLVSNIFNPNDGKTYRIDSASGTCNCVSNLCGAYIDAGTFNTIEELRNYPWKRGKLYKLFIVYPPNELSTVQDMPNGAVFATWDYYGSISNPAAEVLTLYQNLNKYVYTIGNKYVTCASALVHGCSDHYRSNTVDEIFKEIGEKGAIATLTDSQLYALDKMFKIAAYSSDEASEAYEEFVDAFGIDAWIVMANIDTAKLKEDCQLSYCNNVKVTIPSTSAKQYCEIPYTYTPSNNRTSYPYFDLFVEPGYEYAIEFESTAGAQVCVQMYDEIALQAIADGVDFKESQNATGWTSWAGSMEATYQPVKTLAGYMPKAMRFVFNAKYAGITKCIIYKKKVR